MLDDSGRRGACRSDAVVTSVRRSLRGLMRVPQSKVEAQVNARHRTAHAGFGASSEGNMPARSADSGGSVAGEPKLPPTGTRWIRRVGRILRDAILMAGILAMVPVTTVLLTSSQLLFWRSSAIYGDAQ